MTRANKAPYDVQDDKNADDIAAPHMQGIRAADFLFGAQIRHGESRDERPMPEAYQRVPYESVRRPACCLDGFAGGHPSSPAPRAMRLQALSRLTLI
jgi:hypothetical protein